MRGRHGPTCLDKYSSSTVILSTTAAAGSTPVASGNMCINAATPAWVRVRHWSAPERGSSISTKTDLDDSSSNSTWPWEVPLTMEEQLVATEVHPAFFTATSSLMQLQQDYRARLCGMQQKRERRKRVAEENDHIPEVAVVNQTNVARVPDPTISIFPSSILRPSAAANLIPRPTDVSSEDVFSTKSDGFDGGGCSSGATFVPAEVASSPGWRHEDPHASIVVEPKRPLEEEETSSRSTNGWSESHLSLLSESKSRESGGDLALSTREELCCCRGLPAVARGESNSFVKEETAAVSLTRALPRSCERRTTSRWKEKSGTSLMSKCSVAFGAIVLAMCTIIGSSPVDARICPTMTFKDVEALDQLKGCTVIEGNLVISLGIMNPIAQTTRGAGSITVPDLNVTFPDLREITDYLMIYGSKFTPRLTNVFPNLTVIRGNKLLGNYGLIIFKNPDLEEIGLTGLTKILKGGVRIAKNSKLCYANTIDWHKMTSPEFHDFITIKENEVPNACPEICPSHCPKLTNRRTSCWNKETCQRIDVQCPSPHERDRVCYRENGTDSQVKVCDKECVGGCSGDTQMDCYACQNVFFKGGSNQCLNVCPSPWLVYKKWRCISRNECKNKKVMYSGENFQDVKYFNVYKNECLEKCPADTKEDIDPNDNTPICVECKDCPKKCNGGLISSIGDLAAYEGCTHVVGDMIIQLSGANVVQRLEKYLGRVKEISGFLKISRTYPIVSLDFFTSLEVIRGKNDVEYSLQILENENLQKLFPDSNNKSVKIIETSKNGTEKPGHAFIHYNARLCKSEIENLINRSGLFDPGKNSAEISYATNGAKAICSSRKLKVELKNVKSTIVIVEFDNYQKTIEKDFPLSSVQTLLGYEINYREISPATYEKRNLTKYDGRDACGSDDWTVMDHVPSAQEADDNKTMRWPEETAWLSVKPYTYYALFISTMLLKEYSGSQDVEGAESDIEYFQTPEDIPEPPLSVRVDRISFSSFNVSWKPPMVPNGIIDHYELVLEFNEINAARILDRPYCKEGYEIEDMGRTEKAELAKEKEDRDKGNLTIVLPPGTCSCDNCGQTMPHTKLSEDSKIEEDHFFDTIINRVFDASTSSSAGILKRKKRSVVHDSRISSNTIQKGSAVENESLVHEENDNYQRYPVIIGSNMNGDWVYSYLLPKKRLKVLDKERGKFYLTFSERIPGNQTHFFIPQLKHYGSYTLKLRACQKAYPLNATMAQRKGYDDYEKFCSKEVVKEVRVLHKPGADDIVSEITTTLLNDTDTVWISWQAPKDPNEVIVNYNVLIKSKQDATGALFRGCVTAKDFKDWGSRYKLTLPGGYYVSVQAVSVYGPGNWTQFKWVNIPEHTNTMLYIILPILFVVLVVIVGLATCYVKRNKKEDMMIATDNGGYISVSELYKADHWEVNRNLVTLGEELGRGSFGKVHKGVYNDPDKGLIDCAIKTVQEGASHRDCIQFLVEAHTMKSFDTPHVVKLLGVVFRCQPHWVILELMANGDLKNYLRGLRPDCAENKDNRPPPTEREVRQMALEIADGMAYLSTHHKHIVHRDLAARNCMVTGDVVVKIGDFGLAREIYTTDYYRKGDKGYMPVRWMAPESLRDGVATTASDVWSFGVVLWEMVTLAELPYKGYNNQQVVENVIRGRVMERPEGCPDLLWQLMTECWEKNPKKRPSFLDLCSKLVSIANDRFKTTSYFLTPDGQKALQVEEEERRIAREEEEERAALLDPETICLTGNGNSNGEAYSGGGLDNGHVITDFTRQQSTNSSSSRVPVVKFIGGSGNDQVGASTSSKFNMWNMNGGLNGLTKKLRHKSGSASGEA